MASLLIGIIGVVYVLPAAQPGGALAVWNAIPDATSGYLVTLLLVWLGVGLLACAAGLATSAAPASWFLGGAWSTTRVAWSCTSVFGSVAVSMAVPWTAVGAGIQDMSGAVELSSAAAAWGLLPAFGALMLLPTIGVGAMSLAARPR